MTRGRGKSVNAQGKIPPGIRDVKPDKPGPVRKVSSPRVDNAKPAKPKRIALKKPPRGQGPIADHSVPKKAAKTAIHTSRTPPKKIVVPDHSDHQPAPMAKPRQRSPILRGADHNRLKPKDDRFDPGRRRSQHRPPSDLPKKRPSPAIRDNVDDLSDDEVYRGHPPKLIRFPGNQADIGIKRTARRTPGSSSSDDIPAVTKRPIRPHTPVLDRHDSLSSSDDFPNQSPTKPRPLQPLKPSPVPIARPDPPKAKLSTTQPFMISVWLTPEPRDSRRAPESTHQFGSIDADPGNGKQPSGEAESDGSDIEFRLPTSTSASGIRHRRPPKSDTDSGDVSDFQLTVPSGGASRPIDWGSPDSGDLGGPATSIVRSGQAKKPPADSARRQLQVPQRATPPSGKPRSGFTDPSPSDDSAPEDGPARNPPQGFDDDEEEDRVVGRGKEAHADAGSTFLRSRGSPRDSRSSDDLDFLFQSNQKTVPALSELKHTGEEEDAPITGAPRRAANDIGGAPKGVSTADQDPAAEKAKEEEEEEEEPGSLPEVGTGAGQGARGTEAAQQGRLAASSLGRGGLDLDDNDDDAGDSEDDGDSGSGQVSLARLAEKLQRLDVVDSGEGEMTGEGSDDMTPDAVIRRLRQLEASYETPSQARSVPRRGASHSPDRE
jgi:hypothetical protein